MKMQHALLVITSCLLALAPSLSEAHGFMKVPLSRAIATGSAEWEAAGGNGLGASFSASTPKDLCVAMDNYMGPGVIRAFRAQIHD